ncbi:MAG: carboxypeptidase regulatory-like domain-containing protein [Polyangiaceae bacterium]|nr:carboxypeptidase regulatory-like domain-containing protein [Polyangiaceae bacterium]
MTTSFPSLLRALFLPFAPLRFVFPAAACLLAACSSPQIFAEKCGDLRVVEPEVCDEGEDNGKPGHCRADCSGIAELVTIEGDVLAFMTEVQGERIEGATVSIVEHPEMSVVTGADAHFRFEGLEEGTAVTLLVEHPDFKTTQTATITLGPNGVDPFSIQVVPNSLFNALSSLVPLPVEEDKYCVIATTVARLGGSLYVYLRQGAAGAAVSLDPPVSAESGPIYFNENVLPDPDQPATSKDGGVLFYRVPPGDYVMTAQRPDTLLNEVRFQCRAGVIVNAGPPLGLLANIPAPDYGAGQDWPADVDTASTDALCAKTAACVNEDAGVTNYPDVTIESCKAMFANMWASIDASCDETRALRDAARSLYECRTVSCDVTLGGDDVCVPEEEAFEAAQASYGSCLIASID